MSNETFFESGAIEKVVERPTQSGGKLYIVTINNQEYLTKDEQFALALGYEGNWKWNGSEYNGKKQRWLAKWAWQKDKQAPAPVDIGITAQAMAAANRFQGNPKGPETHEVTPQGIQTIENRPNPASKLDVIEAVAELKRYISIEIAKLKTTQEFDNYPTE